MADVTDNANPTNLPAQTQKKVDNGSGDTQLLQTTAQVAFTAVANPPTQAQVTVLRDALIVAGIMRAS